MPPKLTAYQPFDPNPWGGPGGLQFTLSFYSADFNYLDPAHLYYNLYIDGEKQTFTPETYKNLKSNMTDVPYSFSDHTNSISMMKLACNLFLQGSKRQSRLRSSLYRWRPAS